MAIHKRREPWSVHVEVVDEQGRRRDFHVDESQGAELLVKALNKSNNATKSEERRVLEWLQSNVNPTTSDTYLPASGTYSGSVD